MGPLSSRVSVGAVAKATGPARGRRSTGSGAGRGHPDGMWKVIAGWADAHALCSGIGSPRSAGPGRLIAEAATFAGTPGLRIMLAPPRDPEAHPTNVRPARRRRRR